MAINVWDKIIMGGGGPDKMEQGLRGSGKNGTRFEGAGPHFLIRQI